MERGIKPQESDDHITDLLFPVSKVVLFPTLLEIDWFYLQHYEAYEMRNILGNRCVMVQQELHV